MNKAWSFLLVTFGCKVNQYETEAIREAWTAFGGKECHRPPDADVILINSCAITARGEGEARRALLRMQREAPGARVIFTGCAAKLLPSFVPLNGMPKPLPDLLIEQEKKAILLNDPRPLLNLRGQGGSQDFSEKIRENSPPACFPTILQKSEEERTEPSFHIQSSVRRRPVLTVQDGCTHRCTYCIVPSMRPVCRSRAPMDVLSEARRLLSQGFGEIVLSGINLAQYGKDKPEYGSFWDLVAFLERELWPLYGNHARLRISSVSPAQLTERAIDVLAASRMCCPHLHISLQHADPNILRRMGRGHYRAEELEEALENIRHFWPRLGLGCDIIVGFPGEDENAFETLLAFCERVPFTYGHIFPYSPRPGTKAAEFPDRVDKTVQKKRAERIRALFTKKRQEFVRTLLSEKPRLHVICDEKEVARKKLRKGVCEYYVSCYFPQEEKRRGIVPARPCRAFADGLVVEEEDSPEYMGAVFPPRYEA
ncbi:MAG: radical SAM protein [Desulfovibrio sp.]|nr:radical SAM protein [Desulfovibrio sp.]